MATVESCIATAEWQKTMQDAILRSRLFGDAPAEEIACLLAGATERIEPAGVQVVDETDVFGHFLIMLEGRARVSKRDAHGQYFFNKTITAPAFMGEVPLMLIPPRRSRW